MAKLLSGIAALVLVCASAAIAATQTPATKTMPTCKGTTGPVVWYVPANKAYYIRANPHFGKGAGEYMCRVDAIRSIRSAGKAKSGTSMMKSGTTMKSGGAMASPRATAPAGAAGEMQNLPSTPMPRATTGGTSGGAATPAAPGPMQNLPSTPMPKAT